ncbi:MAG: substrate-binding periplasmic protein [Desulfovibrio sp.]
MSQDSVTRYYKKIAAVVMVMTITGCIIFISSISAYAETLRVKAGYFPPQYYQGEDGKWHGMVIDFTNALFQKAGCTPEYLDIPWRRALAMLDAGSLDLMVNLSITSDRSEYINFVGPVRYEKMVLITRKDSEIIVEQLADLIKFPKAVGYINGNYYGEEFKELLQNDQEFDNMLEGTTDTYQNYKKIQAGHISALITERYNYYQAARTLPFAQGLKENGFVVNSGPIYFGFSKRAVGPELLAKLNQAFQELKAEGVFEGILRKYAGGGQ